MRGKFIVISGPSGVGKGSICNKVIKNINAEYSVSYTTRNPRENEIDGVNYFFVSFSKFNDMIKNDELIEYNMYNGNYYGTSKNKVMDKLNEGINIFLEIDVNGAEKIKKIFSDSLLIYIAPPSLDALRDRLIERGTEDITKINERLNIALDEMKKIDIFDYVVINDDIERAYEEIIDIINKKV